MPFGDLLPERLRVGPTTDSPLPMENGTWVGVELSRRAVRGKTLPAQTMQDVLSAVRSLSKCLRHIT